MANVLYLKACTAGGLLKDWVNAKKCNYHKLQSNCKSENEKKNQVSIISGFTGRN